MIKTDLVEFNHILTVELVYVADIGFVTLEG